MSIFRVLIYVVSLALYSLVSLNIHHQCQVINLISPVHFIHGGRWKMAPDQEIDVNTVVKNDLEFDSERNTLKGALIYRIRRRQYTEADRSIQDESKHFQLLVAWHVEHAKECHVRALLAEHEGELDEDKLRSLYEKHWHVIKTQTNPIRSSWLLDDATVLEVTTKVMNGGYRWDIFISEGVKNSAKCKE
jgi:hypothetical protein